MKKKNFKYKKNDIVEVKFDEDNKPRKAVIIKGFNLFRSVVYNSVLLDYKVFDQINECYIIKKVGRFKDKLKKCKTHILCFDFHAKIKITYEFINEYCNFYGDSQDDIIKEFNKRGVNIDDILDVSISHYANYDKSYTIRFDTLNYCNVLYLNEKLLLKFLL